MTTTVISSGEEVELFQQRERVSGPNLFYELQSKEILLLGGYGVGPSDAEAETPQPVSPEDGEADEGALEGPDEMKLLQPAELALR